MGLRGFPPTMFQEIMFQTSAQSDKAIQSYPSANEGCRNGVLIVAGLKCPIMFPKGDEPFIWRPLSVPPPIKTI